MVSKLGSKFSNLLRLIKSIQKKVQEAILNLAGI